MATKTERLTYSLLKKMLSAFLPVGASLESNLHGRLNTGGARTGKEAKRAEMNV